LELKELR